MRGGTLPNGTSPAPRWKSGHYFGPLGARTTVASTIDREYAVPMWVPGGLVDRIGVGITGAGGAGAVARLGIRNALADGTPGTLILDAGTVDASSTGDKEITISQALSAGLIFVTLSPQVGTAATYRAVSTPTLPHGDNSLGNAVGSTATVGYQALSVTGALPASFSLASSGGPLPRVVLRAA